MQSGQHKNTLAAGSRIHWYEIQRTLGQGGFGITYLALDTNLDQQVAIKEYFPAEIVIRDEPGSVLARSDEDADQFQWGLKRFLDEARTLAKFDHPNIVRVFSVFEANNTAYLVMRFEEGESLRDLISRKKHFSEKELLDIALPVLDGLNTIHKSGFIHRDVQPANIYIRHDGEPVLLDFGAARHTLGETRTMTILVSPGYAPIEQYYSEAAQQGPWTDIYGMGATLYRAIAGVKPIDAIERSRGMLGSTRDVLVPAKVAGQGRYSESFLAAIDHALQFNEKERPQTASAFMRELDSEFGEVTRTNPTVSQPSASHQAAAVETSASVEKPGDDQTAGEENSKKSLLVPALIAAVFALGIGAGIFLPGMLSEREKSSSAVETVSQEAAPMTPVVSPVEAKESPMTIGADVSNDTVTTEMTATEENRVSDASTVNLTEPEPVEIRESPEKLVLQSQLEEEARRIATLKEELSGLKAEREKEQLRLEKLEKERKAKEKLAAELERRKQAETLEKQAELLKAQTAAKKKQDLPPRATLANEPEVKESAKQVAKQDPMKPVEDAIAAGNFEQAVSLLKPLAAGGNADAHYQLGKFYHEGRGILANNNMALTHMRNAAWQGQTDAQVALANMYLNGINGIKDPFLAYTWFLVAERNGLYKVAAIRNETEASLQSEQLAQAAALANELATRNR